MVTSNHIHLLVVDDQSDAISKSLQLIEGRTAQQYNLRKNRKGAFWSDRYHVTAIESGEHLIRCLVYIDLNMVRAGVVSHPAEWPHCGYHEIQSPPDRYRIIDRNRLANLCGIRGEEYLRELHLGWTGGELKREPVRQSKWTDSIAVGSENYIELVKEKLGLAARKKQISNDGKTVVIRQLHTWHPLAPTACKSNPVPHSSSWPLRHPLSVDLLKTRRMTQWPPASIPSYTTKRDTNGVPAGVEPQVGW